MIDRRHAPADLPALRDPQVRRHQDRVHRDDAPGHARLVLAARASRASTFLDEADAVNEYVRDAARGAGVRAIVVLPHEGGAQSGTACGINTCNGLGGAVIAIVERLADGRRPVRHGPHAPAYICAVDGRPLTSAASNGRLITDIDLTLDHQTRTSSRPRATTRSSGPDVAAGRRDARRSSARYDASQRRSRDRVSASSPPPSRGRRTRRASTTPATSSPTPSSRHPTRDGALAAFMNPGGMRDPTSLPARAEPLTYDESSPSSRSATRSRP